MKLTALLIALRPPAGRRAGRPRRRRHPLPAVAPDRLGRLRRGRQRHAERRPDRVDGDGPAGGGRAGRERPPTRRAHGHGVPGGARRTVEQRLRARPRHPGGRRRRATTRASFAGRNLVAALRAKIGVRGGIGPAANSTYWGVLALRAAGASVPAATLRYIRAAAARERRLRLVAPAPRPTRTTRPRRCSRCTPPARRCGGRSIAHAFGYLATAQAASHGYGLLTRAARPTASRRRGRSRPGMPAAFATAARGRGCSPASSRAAPSTTSPARRSRRPS